MSEKKFATKADLDRWRSSKRTTEFDWPHVGTVNIQIEDAATWIKVDAAQQRMQYAAVRGDSKGHEKACREFLVNACLYAVRDEQMRPMFTEQDTDFILSLDPAITGALIDACEKHASASSIDMGAAQKNLPATNGASSPGGSGSA